MTENERERVNETEKRDGTGRDGAGSAIGGWGGRLKVLGIKTYRA